MKRTRIDFIYAVFIFIYFCFLFVFLKNMKRCRGLEGGKVQNGEMATDSVRLAGGAQWMFSEFHDPRLLGFLISVLFGEKVRSNIKIK